MEFLNKIRLNIQYSKCTVDTKKIPALYLGRFLLLNCNTKKMLQKTFAFELIVFSAELPDTSLSEHLFLQKSEFVCCFCWLPYTTGWGRFNDSAEIGSTGAAVALWRHIYANFRCEKTVHYINGGRGGTVLTMY